jgi:choline transporter-like protein 2/4/5
MGLCGSCGAKASQSEVFKSASDRWCTDILFLVMLAIGMSGSIAICAVAITANPNLVQDLVYPPDSYGNSCGKGLASEMKKAMYPRLDHDMSEQWSTVASGLWWNFKPTVVCAPECPDGMSLANPTIYGGPSYPCNGTAACGTVPSYYYIFFTEDVVGRCMPLTSASEAPPRTLCVTPDCTSTAAADLNASHPGTVECATVDTQPDAQTTWEVCPSALNCGPGTACCTAHTAACSGSGTLEVVEATDVSYRPTTMSEESQAMTAKFASYVKTVKGGYEGLVVTEGIIALTVFGVAIPILMSFVWAIFLWFFAGIVVYALIAALILSMTLMSIWLMVKAGWFSVSSSTNSLYNASSLMGESTDTEKTWFTVGAFISVIVTVIFVLFIIIWRHCIVRLVAILEECTKVFKAMFFIVLWPMWDLVIQLAVFAYGFVSIYFALNAPASLFSETWHVAVAALYQVFMMFWLSQFVKATVWTSMSAAVCQWFVTTNAPDGEKKCFGMGTGLSELKSGTGLIVCKHLGSMAFGAFIIAVCETIRAIIMTIDYYTQDLQQSNCLLKMAIKCIQYVVACIQKTIEMISYYGFIFVAMRGESFCQACGSTFVFIMKYAAQTAVNKTVVALLTLLIGWSTPVFAAVLAFYYLESVNDGDYASKFNTFWAALMTFIVAFLVTHGVTMVYNCTIDSIYLLAMKDMEENVPPKFMSNDLRKGFGLDEAHKEASKRSQTYKSQAARRLESDKATYTSAGKVESAEGV